MRLWLLAGDRTRGDGCIEFHFRLLQSHALASSSRRSVCPNGVHMKQSDLNHLRRLVGWVRCEIGQSPSELVETCREIAALGIEPESDAAKQRLVEAHDRARAVPQYIRAAVKAMEKMLNEPGAVIEGEARAIKRIEP